jgi:hypothetical protein
MEALNDTMHFYEAERRTRHAGRPGCRNKARDEDEGQNSKCEDCSKLTKARDETPAKPNHAAQALRILA